MRQGAVREFDQLWIYYRRDQFRLLFLSFFSSFYFWFNSRKRRGWLEFLRRYQKYFSPELMSRRQGKMETWGWLETKEVMATGDGRPQINTAQNWVLRVLKQSETIHSLNYCNMQGLFAPWITSHLNLQEFWN